MEEHGFMPAVAGVDYKPLDRFKMLAQHMARATSRNAFSQGYDGVEATRGESAYLVEAADHFLTLIEEGLGTKHLVADAVKTRLADDVRRITGRPKYDDLAVDAAACVLNDLATSGARPVVSAMHLNVGDSAWFDDESRSFGLLRGWRRACDAAGCIWGGGETATLKDVFLPGAWTIGGSAVGVSMPKRRWVSGERVKPGDRIVFIGSNGIHANGLTDARAVAERLSQSYGTVIAKGLTYGDALLAPTHVYSRFVADCLDAGVAINYIVNVTGHGWRKLMRLEKPLAYVVDTLPEPHPLFEFLEREGGIPQRRMYATFNMGVGMAFIMPEDSRNFRKMLDIAVSYEGKPHALPIPYVAGHVEASAAKKVVIAPLGGMTFDADTLAIR